MSGSGLNALVIEVYERGSITAVPDPAGDLTAVRVDSFDTAITGGMYGPISLYIPRAITLPAIFKLGNRLVVRNAMSIVWEGEIVSFGYSLGGEAEQGLILQGVGFYGGILGKQTWNKRWADTRLGADMWRWDTSATSEASEKIKLDRNNRLRFTPTQVQFTSNPERAAVYYTMPTGQTIKRVTLNYDLQEVFVTSPKNAKHNNAPAGADTFTDLTNAFDGDDTTSVTVTITSDDYLWIKLPQNTLNIGFVRFDFGATVNAATATLSAVYPVVDSSGNVTYSSLTITDGTSSGGKTFAQDGDVTFTLPEDIGEASVDSERARWIRFGFSANLTASIVINEIQVGKTQAWTLRLRDRTGSSNIWSVSASGTGSQDTTLGTPRQELYLEFLSAAVNQDGEANGTVYGEVSDVVVYSETGSINLTEIAKDIVGQTTDLNSSTSFVDSNTFSLVPFVTDGHETMAEILERALAYGDASFNEWIAYLDNSELVASPNGKPVLVVKERPSLTDYEYVISVNDKNLLPPFQLARDLDRVFNWIVVSYRDEENSRDIVIGPDDDSNLKDDDSISIYGKRVYEIPIKTADSTTATNVGRKFLAANKDPQWYVSGPLTVQSYIKGSDGNEIPASGIRAGNRVKIEDFVDEDLIFLISQTTYTDQGETCAISTGTPDDLAIFLSRI